MTLLALGLNHHTAPVEIRERAAIGENQLMGALRALQQLDAVNEATIVSTCNRTEIYCGMRHTDSTPVLNWLHEYLDINKRQFVPHLFQHADQAVVKHLMRVCSGLDSLVLGEPQILGQIKQAYREATDAGAIGSELSTLFQSAFSVAKQVRTDTDIGANPVSVAFAAINLAKQIFADFSQHSALMIGAGDTIQLASRHLKSNHIGNVVIANRTVERAATLAQEVDGQAIGLDQLTNALPQADIIISSTGAPMTLVSKADMEKAMRKRRYRPVLIVDIAVPRDVEAQVAEIDGIYLYTVDDLHSVIDEGLQNRQAAAKQAEEIVLAEVDLFMQRQRIAGASNTISAYRNSVSNISTNELEKSLKQLRAGQDPESVMQHLVHSLSNKLMHKPTQRIREAAQHGNTELLNAAKTLLDLDNSEK